MGDPFAFRPGHAFRRATRRDQDSFFACPPAPKTIFHIVPFHQDDRRFSGHNIQEDSPHKRAENAKNRIFLLRPLCSLAVNTSKIFRQKYEEQINRKESKEPRMTRMGADKGKINISFPSPCHPSSSLFPLSCPSWFHPWPNLKRAEPCCGRSPTEPRRRPQVSLSPGRPVVSRFGGVRRLLL